MGLVGEITVGTKIRAHPVGRVGFPDTVDDDVASLADAEGDDVGSIRFDWHEIIGDDGHVMAVDGEALDTFGTAVDQPEAVLLSGVELELGDASVGRAGLAAGDEGAVVVHLPVDEIVVGEWRCASGGLHDLFDDFEVFGMIPVAKHDWANVIIVRDLRRTVDDHRSSEASGVLSAVVRMIPRGSIEVGKE